MAGGLSRPIRIAACFHGFLRTGVSMLPVRWRLKKEGYTEVSCPTLRYELAPIELLGERAASLVQELSRQHGGTPVDLVTHSMGGLVARAALRHHPPVRRIVMLAPPNQGAQAALKMRQLLPVHRLGWDPLQPLLPGSPDRLPLPGDPPVEVGILIGGRGQERGYSPFLDGDNDGKVRVEEARLPGAADFKVVQARHPLVMAQPSVLDLVVRFLDSGRFGTGDEPAAEGS